MENNTDNGAHSFTEDAQFEENKNVPKKHIIFIGGEETGKTLFSKLIFGEKKTFYINGRSFHTESFPYDNGSDEWEYENVLVDDLNSKYTVDDLLWIIGGDKLHINRQCRSMITVDMPRFIFITNFLSLPDTDSFRRRFYVIDSTKSTIADLMKMIKEEKIIVEAARF